jgi:hypothetical protein
VQGKPDVYPRYGDRQGAWAQRNTDANQFIEVIVIDFEVKTKTMSNTDPPKTQGGSRCSQRVSSSCLLYHTHHITHNMLIHMCLLLQLVSNGRARETRRISKIW